MGSRERCSPSQMTRLLVQLGTLMWRPPALPIWGSSRAICASNESALSTAKTAADVGARISHEQAESSRPKLPIVCLWTTQVSSRSAYEFAF